MPNLSLQFKPLIYCPAIRAGRTEYPPLAKAFTCLKVFSSVLSSSLPLKSFSLSL